jgi:type II secretory pathway component PulM
MAASAASRFRSPRHLALLNDNVRLFISVAVAILVQALVDLPGRDRPIVAWDVAAILYLALTWWFMLNPRAWDTRRWIAAQDAPRSRVFALVLGAQANLV